MADTHGKSLSVKLPLCYQDAGCEQILDLLLRQGSQLAVTRLFRQLAARAWHQALPPFPEPTQEEKQAWLLKEDRLAVNLRVTAGDPITEGLYEMLAQLPDHRSRVAAVRRMFFDALFKARPPVPLQESALMAFMPSTPANSNSCASSSNTRAAPPPVATPDYPHASPVPARAALEPEAQTLVQTSIASPAPRAPVAPTAPADAANEMRRKRRALLSSFQPSNGPLT